MSVPIGIDLGSTCCRLAVAGEYSGDDFATPSWCPGYSLILDHGAPVPSVIAGTAQGPPFDDRGDILVGRHALHQENQFRLDITRLLAGRTSADREQIAVLTQLLKHLRILAEKNLHQDVAEAVVGIPATFKYQDLQPIVEASKLAGFAAIKRLSQPAATALACFWGDTSQLRQILVYDFGGTKFEAAVVEIVNDNAMILSTAVDQHLGGRDLDERLAVWIEEQLRNHGYNLGPVDQASAPRIQAQLMALAQQAKVRLSAADTYALEEVVAFQRGDALNLSLTIEREQFEALIEEPVERTLKLCQDALDQSDLGLADIRDVVITGGSSCIPFVAQRLEQELGRKPRFIGPEAVAVGAAIVTQHVEWLEPQSQSVAADTGWIPEPPDYQDTSPTSKSMEQEEREKILEALEATHGNITKAAEILGESTQTIRNKMRREGITHHDIKPDNILISRSSNSEANPHSDEDVVKVTDFGIAKVREGTLEVPGGRVDRVHFTVTAPRTVGRGEPFTLIVWAHLEVQRSVVVERTREALGAGPLHIQTRGPTRLARGTTLRIRLWLDGLSIERPEDTMLWEGEIGNATFAVRVPNDAREGARQGRALIFADGLEIARVNFTLEVGPRQAPVEVVPAHESRHRTAFASYARSDKIEVGARIQGMQKAVPDLQIFWDVLSLRSGQKWEKELWDVIPSRDVFYLFWSRAASRSEWVEKEWRCALKTRGIDYIDPVPLVSPEEAPPPPELAQLHFDDWTLAFTRYQRSQPLGKI